ncbi:MAG: hypothetical protein AB8B69_16000 [Chitinophagales bacterium]
MHLPEQILENVQHDVDIYSDYLQKIAKGVIDNKISEYPIFVAHREPSMNIGRPIIIAEQMQTDWSFNASLIEEFVKKSLIEQKKVATFKHIYKDATKYACLFIISGDSDAGFVFCPYKV